MRYPKLVLPGDTLGIVAPSFGAAIEPYATTLSSAEKKFSSLGYKIHEYSLARAGEGVGISSTPQKCAYELVDAYMDAYTDALLSAGGGELMCEILPYLNMDALTTADPKWFVGYSDNTNFGFLLNTCFDTASLYAPCAPTFGMEPWHESLYDTLHVLDGSAVDGGKVRFKSYDSFELEGLKSADNPLAPYNTTESTIMSSYESAGSSYKEVEDTHFEGRLIGGCLDCLTNLVGTPFDKVEEFIDKHPEGIVWALEACDLHPMDVRRALWHLNQAGWFRNTRGFLIGRPYFLQENAFGLDQIRAHLSAFENAGIDVPVVTNMDMGHLPPMMPLVMGSYVDVLYRTGGLSLEMSFD